MFRTATRIAIGVIVVMIGFPLVLPYAQTYAPPVASAMQAVLSLVTAWCADIAGFVNGLKR